MVSSKLQSWPLTSLRQSSYLAVDYQVIQVELVLSNLLIFTLIYTLSYIIRNSFVYLCND